MQNSPKSVNVVEVGYDTLRQAQRVLWHIQLGHVDEDSEAYGENSSKGIVVASGGAAVVAGLPQSTPVVNGGAAPPGGSPGMAVTATVGGSVAGIVDGSVG